MRLQVYHFLSFVSLLLAAKQHHFCCRSYSGSLLYFVAQVIGVVGQRDTNVLSSAVIVFVTVTASFVQHADASRNEIVNEHITEVDLKQQQQCTVMTDGSCIEDETNNNDSIINNVNTKNDDNIDDIIIIPPVPIIGDDGFVEIEYGEKQQIHVGTNDGTQKCIERLQEMHTYMYRDVYYNISKEQQKYKSTLKNDCKNRHISCVFWASIGECTANPAYMKIQCAPACMSCEQVLFETRCPISNDINDTNVWNHPGDLNIMFENIVSNYNTSISFLLRPGMKSFNTNAYNKYKNDSPWVVVIDNFTTPEECNTLIELGAQRGYEISKDVGERKFDGTYDAKTSNGRTSTNAWCLEECYTNATTQNVLNKIVELTNIPDINSEYLQLLKYDVGQFYETHHDYIGHHIERQQGVRILTVFLYLNDVEEGGGTNFPILNITIMPQRGRALIWPSVKDENPNEKDPRTDHQALPVNKGIKYGANAWLHLRDFKTPYNKSCI